ncbi:hypothetical protein [Corynebacterium sp. HS2168-gen11]|uniref:hypothetical protein n=1 Tax=Corynebacterium sp. HS2168-gen11 TaxID=2974027 RepID=UPI00216AF783|nr:hypothetical protein [Corynebacterium sp. HS2168-gen11]MCS4535791.1 hypothetical protein [Corynebacterium sp. HS2168-gen11]
MGSINQLESTISAEQWLYFLCDFVDQVVYFHLGRGPENIERQSFFALDDAERRRGLRVLELPQNNDIGKIHTKKQLLLDAGISLLNLNFPYTGHEVFKNLCPIYQLAQQLRSQA